MTSAIYEFVSSINSDVVKRYLYKVFKVLFNVFYPFSFCFLRQGIDSDSEIIVSLTTFPARIDTVWITIMTLLRQSVRPFKIVLWLSTDEFPNMKKGLPSKLLRLEKYGLDIRFCDNLYSHKKYYYSMKEFPNYYIVTVDDDMFYPENLLQKLIETHFKYPNAVVCSYAHRIIVNEEGKIEEYDNWIKGTIERGPAFDLMPVGFGGVLYPPDILSKKVFDKECILINCPKTDDLWLKFMSLKNKKAVVRCDTMPFQFFSIIRTQKSSLLIENVHQKKNDIAIEKLSSLFPKEVKMISSRT